MPEISVIVPIYNSEKYLSKCIDSILSQTYTDFELILINDGSSDSSLALCYDWAEKDRRIIVINKVNGGVSSARNAGIEKAEGNWIAFIDSDDWIDADYLSSLIEHITTIHLSPDWITSGISYHYDDGSKKKEGSDETTFYLADSSDGLLSIATQQLVTSPVGKLYRAAIIKDNKLLFDNLLSFGEDRDFNIDYLSHCQSCLITSYNGYNYRKDIPSSLSSVVTEDILEVDLLYWSKLYRLFCDNKFMTIEVRRYLINRLYNFIIDNFLTQRRITTLTKFLKKNINWTFVKENSSLIEGNGVYRFLLRYQQIGILTLFILARRL